MPVMDEFREEREALKHGTLKQKVSYFFDYYKWHTIAVIAVVAMTGSILGNVLFGKDTAFYAALVNAAALPPAEAYNQGFAEYAGIDTAHYDLSFDSSLPVSLTAPDEQTMATRQKLLVYVASQEIDVLLAAGDVMDQYVYNDTFWDLREVLSEEQLAKYSPFFYYMDMAVMEELEAARDSLEVNFTKYPDPRQPDLMCNPVPVGIYLDNAHTLKESYYFSGGEPVIGVVVNTKRPETASKYIDYILQ